MKRSLVLVLALLLVSCRSASVVAVNPAATPALLPDSIVQERNGGDFKLSILRKGSSAEDRRLISMAESVAPDTALLRSMRNAGPLLPSDPLDRWWYGAHDGTYIPYAITAKMVWYLQRRWEALAAGGGGPDLVTFSYTAEIQANPAQAGLTTVVLRVNWMESCKAAARTSCYWSFAHERRVVIDGSGRVVRIEGDGKPSIIVS